MKPILLGHKDEPSRIAPAGKTTARGSIWELIQSLPPGPRSASTWEEIERTLQEDRDSWDRPVRHVPGLIPV